MPMTKIVLQHIQKSQSEYQQLIIDFNQRCNPDELTWQKISYFLDELIGFWLERLDIVDVELEALTENKTCFLLSGAVFLNLSGNEHFYFKSLGDFHILPDPFLQMEHFFRASEASFDSSEIISYFRRVLEDTLKLLKNHQNSFYILPVRLLAIEDTDEHKKLLDSFFLSFLSSIFKKEYSNQDQFIEDFDSFEDIDNSLDSYVRQRLVFNDPSEGRLPLRKKIELHSQSQASFKMLLSNKREAEVFLITLFSYLSQVSDTLLLCSIQRFNPYIRYEVTFHYLVLVMYTFIDDENLRSMIEKAIIFYVFRKAMDGVFDHYDSFDEYCSKIATKNALPRIISKMREQEIDIFHSGIHELAQIIEQIFDDVIESVDDNDR